MSVAVSDDPLIVSTAQTVALSQLIDVVASAGDPAYLVLNAFDRNEYTASASGATGTLNGNGLHFGLTTTNGDARETGIVFSYQLLTGRYYNASVGASVGYLDQLTYTTSSSLGDITDLSLFGTGNLHTANAYATDAYSLMAYDPGGYLGSATVATLPNFGNSVPSQATPGSIAAIADSFIGQAWNMNGCWTLTSAIAAEAGASLPVQSTIEIAGQPNGEWFVAYNGPAGATGNWQSMVQTGDMIGFITGSGGGHITTCVSGSGSNARLVDNETLVDQYGNVLNPANDGSANDVVIEAPHAASQEWDGVNASSVVIYRLDTPQVSTTESSLYLAAGAQDSLAGLFSAADPEGKAVADYQVYEANTVDALVVNGAIVAADSTSTVTSLSSVSVDAGQSAGADQISVRAYNGAYWGDWITLSITSGSGASTPTPSIPNISSTTVVNTPATTTATISSGTVSVYRFFDTLDGTHFFTASTTERDSLIASRPDLVFEGIGMNAVSPSANDPAAEAVYRFFDAANGTHFYTASTSERDSLIAATPSMTFEGAAFYEDATPVAGDSAVYRFFDTVHGTHLFTESATEQASILATRPDLKPEGIAFYAPSLS